MTMSWNNSMLGIAIEGRMLSACVVRRHGRRLDAGKSLRAELTLDPLAASPELAGQEIRNRLDESGLRGRQCIVAVPASWAFPLQLVLPDVSEEDQRAFIELQAERELPFSVEDLVLSVARWGEPNGPTRATVLAMPRTRVDSIEKVIRAAKLNLVGITTGAPAFLAPAEDAPDSHRHRLSLLLSDRGAEMLAWVDGVAALRTVEESTGEDQHPDFDAEAIARQIRITLGQLPPDPRSGMKELIVVGEALAAAELAEELKAPAGKLGLAPKSLEPAAVSALKLAQHAPAGIALAAAVAGRALLAKPAIFEFLPPHEQRWKTIARRLSARGTMWGAALAAFILLVAVSTIGYQYYQLSGLDSRWKQIEPEVRRVEALQDQIRRYRPWYDDSAPSLLILKSLTQAFPEDGSVWARMIQIKDQQKVTCTGSSKTDRDWQKMASQLQESAGVDGLHMDVQGQTPQQFTMTYVWKGGKPNAE